MLAPKVFIGSSKQNLRIAELLGEGLEEEAAVEVTVWNEGVFSLNRGVLEDLLGQLDQFDFAVLILAPDDMTISKDQLSPSTRDNVLFECGLFMGKLGRDRVFVVYDTSIELKIPSDLAGVTLAPYDGSRISSSTPAAATRKACRLIGDAIMKPTFSHIVGEWRSKYRLAAERNHPLAEEDVEVTPSRGGICITNKNNSQRDDYIARGDLAEQRFIMGKWKAAPTRGSTNGMFLLTVNPLGTIMYGYATGNDEKSGTIYGTWVLAKKDGANEAEIAKRLNTGEELLKDTIAIWQIPTNNG